MERFFEVGLYNFRSILNAVHVQSSDGVCFWWIHHVHCIVAGYRSVKIEKMECVNMSIVK